MSSSKLFSYDADNKIWSGPNRPCLYNTNVSAGYVMLNALKNTPDRIMQVCDDTGVELTCSEMYKRSIIMAKFLSEKLNLKECDIVGFIVNNSENVASCVFACLSMGFPLNPLAKVLAESDVIFMFSMTKPKLIICDRDSVEKVLKAVEKMRIECLLITMDEKVEGFDFVGDILENFEGNVNDFEFPTLTSKALSMAAILSSSGTSTKTKGIVKPHRQIIETIPNWADSHPRESNTILLLISIFWNTSYWFMMAAAAYGDKMIITSKYIDPKYFYELVNRQKVTVTNCMPFFGKELLKSSDVKAMESVKLLVVLGSIFNAKFVKDLERIVPKADIGGCYGSTEGDVLIYTKKIGENGATSGTPCANVKLKIIDENGISLGPNSRGQICFKSPTMFTSYFNEPELTSQAFDAEGWGYSGDVGYFDNDGCLFIVDRIKHLLKFKNLIFTPHEVEEIINQIDGVTGSCVVGVYDEIVGYDIIYAFIIKNQNEIDENFIIDYVAKNTSDAKRIRGAVFFVDDFPTTPTRKIKTNVLKEIAREYHGKINK